MALCGLICYHETMLTIVYFTSYKLTTALGFVLCTELLVSTLLRNLVASLAPYFLVYWKS